MKSASLKEIKTALETLTADECAALILRLAKFKKENKESITYWLFESHDETAYVAGVCSMIDQLFDEVNTDSLYYAKKTIRKIIRVASRYAKYSEKDSTEVELLIYVCMKFKALGLDLNKSQVMKNMYTSLLKKINKSVAQMHEDLQYDYHHQLNKLEL